MELITVIVVVVLIAVGFWANNTYVQPPPLRLAFNIILMVAIVLLIAALFGGFNLHQHVGN